MYKYTDIYSIYMCICMLILFQIKGVIAHLLMDYFTAYFLIISRVMENDPSSSMIYPLKAVTFYTCQKNARE